VSHTHRLALRPWRMALCDWCSETHAHSMGRGASIGAGVEDYMYVYAEAVGGRFRRCVGVVSVAEHSSPIYARAIMSFCVFRAG
jgi:hypothetical protein